MYKKTLKLTVDILPKSAWGGNLSKTLSQKDWDIIRKKAYAEANYKCVCCGAEGKLHAHETWDFDIPTKTQTLLKVLALCESCHNVKHFGRAQLIGREDEAIEHFLAVNLCSKAVFLRHIAEASKIYSDRCKVEEWNKKAPLLDELNIKY